MALGYRYLQGINVETSCEQALRYYRKVASKVIDHVPITGKSWFSIQWPQVRQVVVIEIYWTGGPSVQKIRLYEEWENPAVNNNMDDDLLQYYTFVANKGDGQAQVGVPDELEFFYLLKLIYLN